MSFKENLIKKLKIEALAKAVSVTAGSPGSSKKIDKEKMRELLMLSPYTLEKRRDLELYHRNISDNTQEVLVLDNELPLFGNTTLEEVALRRSPELKEMISIRNIIKILNDSDIVIGKGRDAITYIRDRSLENLDLRYTKQDIQDMADEALEAFARAETRDVLQMLELFVEILGYTPLPAEAGVNDYVMFGALREDTAEGKVFASIVMYNEMTNALKLIIPAIALSDPVARNLIQAVAIDEMEPDKEGPNVFPFLAQLILAKKTPTLH